MKPPPEKVPPQEDVSPLAMPGLVKGALDSDPDEWAARFGVTTTSDEPSSAAVVLPSAKPPPTNAMARSPPSTTRAVSG